MSKKPDGWTQARERKEVTRFHSIDNEISMVELVELTQNKKNARIVVDRNWDNTDVNVQWEEMETDEEYAHRMKMLDRMEKEAKRKEEREKASRKLKNTLTEAQERKLYERLRKKFETP